MTPVFTYRKSSGFVRVLLALTLAGMLRPAVGQAVPAGGWVPLWGHRTAAAASARDLGHVATSQSIDLTLALRPRDPAGLNTLLHRLYNSQDTLYRHFLTPAQFAARFSPTPTQYAAVVAFARSQGLTVTGTTQNRLLLHLQAPSAAVEAAFGVGLHRMQDAEGRQFHAPDAEPVVPAALAPLLTGVIGLDDSAVWHPHFERLASNLPPVCHRPAARSVFDAVTPDVLPSQTGSGPGGGLTPADIKTAYNLNGVALTGTGQTLAVFELDGYHATDITAYEKAYGLPNVTLQNVIVDGGPVPALGGGQAEVTLDIELQAALAPGTAQAPSTIRVYEGPNTSQGLLDTYTQIAQDNQAKLISTSWGLDEQDMGSSFVQSESAVFQQMATQGQTLFAAAGDSGAYDGAVNPTTNSQILSVDDPASQPLVTGVGGTSLATAGAGGPYSAESTWNNGSGSAGGGGISVFWGIPSWQQGIISPASKGSTTMRNVPDVAMDANPNTGYSIYLSGGWALYGGTSCAAPLWSAYAALVNQQRLASGTGLLGYANPVLYAAARGPYGGQDFHDIADGSTNLFYPAIPGYDDATGWGSLNGANLLADLAPPLPAGLTAATTSTSQVTLSWGAVPNAVGYTVLRGGAHGGPYAQVGTTTGTTTFADTGLTPGTAYYYVVNARTAAETSGNSNEASATPTALAQSAPAPPSGLSAAAGNAAVSLSWNPVGSAASYNVYRGASSGGEGTTPYRTGLTAPSFTDTGLNNNTTYYYQVTALGQSSESTRTTEVSATPVARWLMQSPGIGHVIGRLDADGWSANTAQDPANFLQYGPYVPTAAGAHTASWELMVDNNTFAGDGGPVLELQAYDSTANVTLAVRDVQRREFTAALQYQTFALPFTLAAPGDKLEFRVLWLRKSYVRERSVALDLPSAPSPAPAAPSTPTGLAAAAGNAQTTLSWNGVSGASSYNVKRGTQSGGPYSTISTAGAVTSATFTDTGLTNGATYYYIVTAVNTAGESPASNEAATTPTPPAASWLMQSPGIGHVIGRLDADGWSANTAQDPANFLQYGPYVPTAAGAHTASWELMVDNNTFAGDGGPVLELQAYDSTANVTLAVRDVQRREFTAALQYQTFALPFTLAAPGDKLEFRVLWLRKSYVRERSVALQ